METKIKEMQNLISESKSVALFAHINADGDAVGSVMATKHYLDDIGKETYVFLQEPISQDFAFLGVHKFANKNSLQQYDLAICLDSPTTKRFGEYEKEFFKAKKSIKIDHHILVDEYATLEIVDSEISSACELLYGIFKKLNVNITPEIATCLYTGIATDTGGFLHGNHGEVTPNTWRTIAELVESGADLKNINYNVFIRMSKGVFELNKEVLSRAEFFAEGKIAMVTLPNAVLQNTGTELMDTHKFIDLFTGIDGVEITAFLTELKANENAVSVRSQNHSAQRICKHFGGGGHLKAAGCRIFVPLEIAKSLLLEECKNELYRND